MTPRELRDHLEANRPPISPPWDGPADPPLSGDEVMAMLDYLKDESAILWQWRCEWAYFLGAGWFAPLSDD